MTLALVWQTFHEAFTAMFFQNAKFTKLFRICSCFSEVVRTSSTSKWHFIKIRQFTKQKRTVITEKVFGVTRRLHSNGFAGISFPKLSKFVFSSTFSQQVHRIWPHQHKSAQSLAFWHRKTEETVNRICGCCRNSIKMKHQKENHIIKVGCEFSFSSRHFISGWAEFAFQIVF